jgi:hypothetical protein
MKIEGGEIFMKEKTRIFTVPGKATNISETKVARATSTN